MSRKKKSSEFEKKKKADSSRVSFSQCFLIVILLTLILLASLAFVVHRREADRSSGKDTLRAAVFPTLAPTMKPVPLVRLTTHCPTVRATLSRKQIFNSASWGYHNEHTIAGLTSLSMDKLRNRRIVFANITIELPSRSSEPASGEVGNPRELIKANEVLMKHPLHQLDHASKPLDDVMYYVKNSEHCLQKPVFLSMATVQDDLYWQLIENFVYTMVKFGVSDCSLVICVSDPKCMKLCDEAHFPCYLYTEKTEPVPSVMEQIANLKLFHVPKALARGVDVFMLDLDVGFLEDPQYMVKAFVETPIIDMLVQEDMTFIMNRTVAGWKQWWTEPLPNIGLLLVRGNEKTARVFGLAWERYQESPAKVRVNPGKDQNHVLEAMRIGKHAFGLKFAYFDNSTAPLLDKVIKNHGTAMELGGDLTGQFLLKIKSIAMHTTCYERSTKVMGLKATNSFWNPRYYDPLRPTITKQILYVNEKQLLDEVRSLVWLAMATGRSLIIPNILGDNRSISSVAPYQGQVMWPGFRVAYFKNKGGRNVLPVTVLEPAYYWRVERDYDAAPEPHIVYFDPEVDTLRDLKRVVLALVDRPRVVLHPVNKADDPAAIAAVVSEVGTWAKDSVGLFGRPYADLVESYRRVPSVKEVRSEPMAEDVLQGMRNCARVFNPFKGNRSCFQICK